MVPRIRAAIHANKPPLMFILEDPKHEWGKWDIRLAKAYELNQDITNGGVPIYWDRSERVAFEVGSFVSKSKAALDRAEEKASKGKTKNYGKVFYPIPKTIDGGPLPTLEEYLEEMRENRAGRAGSQWDTSVDRHSPYSNADWKPPEEPLN